jgi:hypothetical protein
LIQFALAEGAWDLGTAGVGDIIDLAAFVSVSGTAATAAMSFGAEALGNYVQYYMQS